jgi:DNA-binding transcriptional LysR family regulator
MNDWDDVRFFLEVARNGNLTQAAKALGVNHSTVSRRIKSLENKINSRLFERTASGYVLTDYAEDIYQTALEIEENHQTFARRLQNKNTSLVGKITLTMPHDIFEFFLVDHIADFQKQFSDIELDLLVSKGVRNLNAREADIAIRLTDLPPEYLVGKNITPLLHDLYKPKNLEVFEETPIVVWTSDEAVPEWAKKNCINPKIKLRVDDLFAMYRAVESGVGLARMPVYIHHFCKSLEIERMMINGQHSSWGVWVLSHVDLRKSVRVKILKDFLSDCIVKNKEKFSQ